MTLFREPDKKLVSIKVTDIAQSTNQPRRSFDEYELHTLTESIRANGIIQPLTVRKSDEGYLLIAGERRLRAAKRAGLKKVPCVVVNVTSVQAATYSIIENLQRSDLNFFEQAEGISRLINDFSLNQLEAAERLGIAQSTLTNKLRILRLSFEERERIIKAGLTERHARALIRINDVAERIRVLEKVISENMTAKECEAFTERLVNFEQDKGEPPSRRKSAVADTRLFSNSINRLVETMVASGIKATHKKQENKDYIEYRIKISKQKETQSKEESPQLKIC